jgi:hypothetical protein
MTTSKREIKIRNSPRSLKIYSRITTMTLTTGSTMIKREIINIRDVEHILTLLEDLDGIAWQDDSDQEHD